MKDRIIIEFDDNEDQKAKTEDERIVIDFDEENKNIEVENIEPGRDEIISRSVVNSFYKGNSHLNYSYNTDLKFPEGIEQGFRKKFSLNLKDEFFNCVLENNKFIVLASKRSSVYLVDRITGKVDEKLFFENESFEKTGLVFNNVIYLNSLKKIYNLSTQEEKVKQSEVYSVSDNFFIWSNLNRYKDFILFTEFSSLHKKAYLRIINTGINGSVSEFEIRVHDFISDKICIADEFAFLLFDTSILVYDLERMKGEIHSMNILTDENSFIFYLNYRIYITSKSNELFYLDIPPVNFIFKTTGIRNNYINSIGGFADNIFIGTLDGWKYYKSSGLQVYSFEDEYENRIESISKNVLVISQKNKIVFCNLNRFQEAEGYVIASDEKSEAVEIISAVISSHDIFVLTGNGILDVFTNDKLNIHV